MSHTPGPWRVRSHPSLGVFVDAPGTIIRNPRGPDYCREILSDEDYPEKADDARLIAAAPTMLAALREYKRLRDQYRPEPAAHEWMRCEERIDAAIQAATGGAS